MAPVPESTLTTLLTTLLRRLPSASPSPHTLTSRSESPPANPGTGVTPFEKVPNKAIFSLFGLIGVFFVVTGIWFFFHAKNGGFYFSENDWDDYKSTVLRRKGPNGTTLSGATESTDLGGGSVVHGMNEKGGSVWGRMTRGRGGRKKKTKRYQDFDEETAYMGSAGGSSLDSELGDLKKEKQRAQKVAKEKKSRFRRNKRLDDEETVVTEALSLSHAGVEEDVDQDVRDAVRAYRHEKPARVGGLNKPAEGSNWDGSTEASSDLGLMSHREPTPTNTPTKKIRKERNDNYTGGNSSGIRKVVSTSQGRSEADFWNRTNEDADRERERERIRVEARKLQEKGRAASQSAHSRSQSHGRRDFSFQHGDDTSTVVSSSLTSTTTSTEDREREARREARREERERRRVEREMGRSGSPKKLSVPGSFVEDSEVGSNVSGDTGTKSYPCVIPGLSVKKEGKGGADEYKEERRKRRANGGGGGGGYRRGRRDSLE